MQCYSALIMPDIIKNLPLEIKKNKLKISLIIGLSAYWMMILVGTVVTFK